MTSTTRMRGEKYTFMSHGTKNSTDFNRTSAAAGMLLNIERQSEHDWLLARVGDTFAPVHAARRNTRASAQLTPLPDSGNCSTIRVADA